MVLIYDAIIVGGGPAGIAAAVRIAQLSGKPVIIEEDCLGGVCTNWGCIPTKAMLASAKLAHAAMHAPKVGVSLEVSIDFRKIVRHRDEQIKISQEHNKEILESYGVEVMQGKGILKDKNHVVVEGKEIEGGNIIICTGSESKTIPGLPTNDRVLTSKEMVSIRELPKRLVIIGGGVIGLEFASLFAYLGSKVVVIEACERLLSGEDPEISAEIKNALESFGVTIALSAKVTGIDDRQVKTEGKGYMYDKVLLAVGRSPALDVLVIEKLGITYDKMGIVINERMQTSLKNVYAIGDATGRSVLAHVGTRQAVVAANTIMGMKDEMPSCIPRCVYSIPEIACAGKTEKEAKSPKVFIYPLSMNAKAQLEGYPEGFIKVILEKDVIVGFQMIGHNVTELVHEATLIVENKMKARDIAKTIHAHPTIGESIKLTVQMAIGECVDVPKGM
ncbi:MAG: dihydrolipoyl dehydrogenase [Nanoarchaeota archaeon]